MGYLPDALPFAFFNKAGDLVGFDIELAHQLAREMGVGLAFVPVDRHGLATQLAEGYCDIVMSGVAVTTNRALEILFSNSYLDETLAFVVPDDQREKYDTWDAIRAQPALKIAVPDVPYYVMKLHELLPRASSRCTTTSSAVRREATHADALALPAERGSAWTSQYPAYRCRAGPNPSACHWRIRSADATRAWRAS